MDNLVNFAERLNELILDKGISWETLADKIGVSRTTVYRWKLQPSQIKLSNLIALADYFECTIEFLIGKSDDEHKVKIVELSPFSICLRKVMSERGITTYKLRKISRYGGKYFEMWDKGTDPLLPTVLELAKILDCTVDYLVGRDL